MSSAAPRFALPIADLVSQLRTNPRWAEGVVADRELPAREAAFGSWPAMVGEDVRRAAASLGIDRLYQHQSDAIHVLAQGENVAVVAGTASGKSLCYQLPIVQARLADPGATAICLFPTKALARDQLTSFEAWERALADPGFEDRDANPLPEDSTGSAVGSLPPAPAIRSRANGVARSQAEPPPSASGLIGAVAYDGDTPSGQRAALRRRARVLLTNPDMLHLSLLPRHPVWAPFFEGLAYVVIDEMHVYRGVFGSHVANVMRRLSRLAHFYGSQPRFVLTSATIANPGEHAARLAGAPVRVIAEDGAPRGKRTFLFYNPPLVDEGMNLRRSALLEAEAAARHFIQGGAQTIVFARSRQSAELIARYVRQGGAQAASLTVDPNLAAVKSYRSGYTAVERREIERGLRSGELRGVVATNALELGIDIGELDACVMAGYPGSIASTWQQAGRVGRQHYDAAAMMVASGAPLDQFVLRQPEYFFGRTPEHARIQPDNLLVLLGHLRSAVFELPFDDDEADRPFGELPAHRYPVRGGDAEDTDGPGETELPPLSEPPAPDPDLPSVGELLAVLEENGEVVRRGDKWYWAGDAYPAADISLRSAGPDVVAILQRDGSAPPDGDQPSQRWPGDPGARRPSTASTVTSTPMSNFPPLSSSDLPAPDARRRPESTTIPTGFSLLGTVERSAAPRMVHAGAVYLHGGEPYRVEHLDWEAGRAYVVPTDDSLYTRASTSVTIRPIRTAATRDAGQAEVVFGELEVFSRTTSYRQVRFGTHETIGWGTIDLPEQQHVAGGYWFMLSDTAVEVLKAIGHWEVDTTGDRGPNWAESRHAARARDGFCCRLCSAPERPDRQHDVHHLRPFREFGWEKGRNDAYRLANDLENLITLCKACHRVAERALGLTGGLGGVGYALSHLAPLYLMCDGADIGVQSESHAPWCKRPAVIIYEQAAGGVGFGEQLFALHEELLRSATRLIASCPCRFGCPSCIGPASAQDPKAKTHALAVLKAVTDG